MSEPAEGIQHVAVHNAYLPNLYGNVPLILQYLPRSLGCLVAVESMLEKQSCRLLLHYELLQDLMRKADVSLCLKLQMLSFTLNHVKYSSAQNWSQLCATRF